jgi:hypothetical protein
VDFIVAFIGVGALLLEDAMQFGKKVKVSFDPKTRPSRLICKQLGLLRWNFAT